MPRRSSTPKYDVVVVGAGNAALTAALSAAEHGPRVLVLEKAPEPEHGGNSRFSGGLFRFCYESVSDLKPLRKDLPASAWERVEAPSYGPDRYMDDLMRVTHGLADKVLSRVLAERSFDTVLWMTKLGLEWQWTELWRVEDGGHLRFSPGSVLEARHKGIGLIERLNAAVRKAGITVAYGAKTTGFLQEPGGRIIGVRVRSGGSAEDVRARAVVLASGGFEANAEMRARYLGPGWDQVKVRGSRFNTGEVLQVALDIGAKPVGHWQGCHATPIDANAPPVGDLRLTDRTNRLSYPYAIMVNAMGRRFLDEGEDLGGYTYAKVGRVILTQPGAIAYQVFDAKTVHLREERYSTGTPVAANTLEEVAHRCGLPEAPFLRTVQEFNAAVQPGRFDPAVKDGKRTQGIEPSKSNWALPIDTPPYTVYPVTGGITFTFGGLQIDTQARVLDTEDIPIPGLYATGEITGGFFWHNYPGGTGLMRGAVFGRVAGAEAAGGE